MADFKQAYDITMGHEGGYVNDPHDIGGETYKGVARKYHPNWKGWKIIDDARSFITSFPDRLEASDPLQQYVQDLYQQLYWDIFQGDGMGNQNIANQLFDIAVNMGPHRAVKFLQSGLNILNRNQQIYSDIVADGRFGTATSLALVQYLTHDSPNYLLKIIIILRGMHYINYMRKSPIQERFARGWLNRVGISQ